MLKKRIIANLVVRNGIVVQSIGFKKYLPVGKPAIAIEFLNQWGIDEIILIDISASQKKAEPDYSMVKKSSKKCFVPLTVGGGITKVDHIKELMHCGTDKISLNQAAIQNPALITEAALLFGNQCVVVSIDAIKKGKGYEVFDYITKTTLKKEPAQLANELQSRGAGEILINSVDRDGSYLGYDITLINEVCNAVTVPVICCGGAKNAADFIKVFTETTVSAASAANFFHFSEHSVNCTKANIIKKFPVRLETKADYRDNSFDCSQRLLKKNDKELEQMLFIRIEKEII
jgi:cyclase